MNHNRFVILLFIVVIMATSIGLAAGSATAQSGNPPRSPNAPSTALGTAFTYQGMLKKSGAPISGACDFRFTLWNTASSGAQLGVTQTLTSLSVVNGLFTAQLDFGNQFTGEARWLQTDVKCAGDSGFTTLSPRQAITAAPYALGLRPGTSVNGNLPSTAIIQTINTNGIGLQGSGSVRAGVLGTTSDLNGSGVEGDASGSNAAGVFGVNTTGPGVWGRGTAGGAGVFGQSSGYAVYGASNGGLGVYGTSSNGGVYGVGYVGTTGVANGTTDSQGVRGEDGANGSGTTTYAGVFNGRVFVTGWLYKPGGSFRIDHPLDPAHKYLSHSFVESPDMKNIYDGVVMLDAKGEAVVNLPDYFEALNMEFRYQLTCIGGYAPVYIAEEITDNQFKIAGGKSGLKVSWQVTGIRHDPYANQNRLKVEEDKPPQEQGHYLYPAGYGLAPEMGVPFLQPVSAPAAGATPNAHTPSKPINPQAGGQ